ncbi:MAG: EAL domain-containing protein [Clostridiales bacterium]|nr:EAL domain-containing protein [Clostridiales bacterium]
MKMSKILVINRDIANRQRLIDILSSDYEILEAKNGQEARLILYRSHETIDAIFLDVVISVKDSFELLEWIKANSIMSQIPLIITIDGVDEAVEARALKLGANDFISEPYNQQIIKQRLKNMIYMRQLSAIINMARKDVLTGLYNRETFFDIAKDMISKHEPGYYVMSCFDIDRFKVINDQYGNETGDKVLKHVAYVLNEGVSAMDGICGRIMADDFVVLYPQRFMDSDNIHEIHQKVPILDEGMRPISFSVGRYIIEDISLPVSGMYDRAVLAQGEARGHFDKNIMIYNESMRDHLLREQRIIVDMKGALEEGQFEVWFQPQYNHSTGAMVGAEVLTRWRHPTEGLLIPPGEFVPVFERNGFIYEMDKYIWEESCKKLRRWIDDGRSPLPISVNVSRYDLLSEDFVKIITGLIEKHEIPVDLLRLEITESAFAQSTEHIVGIVKTLIEYGFMVEIDDFGSGYSSLNTLKDVPAQILKLDMQFLESSEDTDRSGNILESIVRMAKWLGMAVIAEGVETIEQADYLKSIGCIYVQGYLYAKPMSAEEYEALVWRADKEKKLLNLETVENLNNNDFWNPNSIDTLIFNSFVGAAAIVECHHEKIELLRATDTFVDTLGSTTMSTTDALKLNWADYLDQESLEVYIGSVITSFETKDEVVLECTFLDLPGCRSKTYLRTTMRVIAAAGDHYLLYCMNENITAQREIEQKERVTARQLQVIMEALSSGVSGVTMSDGKLEYIFANNMYYSILGYTKEQFEAEVENSLDLIHPDDRKRMDDELEQLFIDRESRVLEYRIIRRDGETIYMRVNASIIILEGVNGVVSLGVSSDITDTVKARQKISVATRQLQFLKDTAGELLAYEDSEIGINHVLKSVMEYFGGDRAFVFEYKYDQDVCSYSYETCGEGITSYQARYCSFPLYTAWYWQKTFEKERFIYIKDSHEIGDDRAAERDILLTIGAKSALAVSLRYGDKIIGAFGVFNPTLQLEDYENLTALADYIVIILMRRDLGIKIKNDHKMLQTMMDDTPGCFVRLRVLSGGSIATEYVNDNFCRLRGMTREEILKDDHQDAMDTIHPDDVEIVREAVEEMIATGNTVTLKYRLRHANGAYIPLSVFGRMTKGEAGTYHINVYYADMSQQEKRVLTVRETMPFVLSAIMASSPDIVFAMDSDFRYICCSAAFVKFIGKNDEKDIIGKTEYQLFAEENAHKFRKNSKRVLETKNRVVDYIEAVPSGDGLMRYFKMSKYALYDTTGNVLGLYCTGRDITEERDAYTCLKLLTNSIPGGIASYIASPEGIKITYFNDGFCEMFGYSRKEYEKISEKGITNITFSEDVPIIKSQVQSMIEDGGKLNCTYRVHTKDGGYKWVNLRGEVSERQGDICLFNAVLYDITELVNAENDLRISEEQFRIAASIGGRNIAHYDIKNGVYYHNTEMLLDMGFGQEIENVPDEFVRRGIIAPKCIADYLEFYGRIKAGEKNCCLDYAIVVHEKKYVWFRAEATVIFGTEEEPSRAIIVTRDITEQREKEAAFQKLQQSLKKRSPESYTYLRWNLNKGMLDYTVDGTLIKVGLEPGSATFNQRAQAYAKLCVCEEDREKYLALLNSDGLLERFKSGKREETLEYREMLSTGSGLWRRVTVELVKYSGSEGVEAHLMYEDIDQQKKAELHAIRLAQTDPLTGVLNRTTFSQRMNQLIREQNSARHVLLMMDIDGFKFLNDALGHATGDQALIDIANSLRCVLRSGDLMGRLGGDEFLICLADVPYDGAIENKARQICSLVRKVFNLEVQISASVGVAIYPEDGKDFETLYRNADTALYRVKSSGKDNFTFFNREGSKETSRTQGLPAPGFGGQAKRRMLVVEDDENNRLILAKMFEKEFLVETADDGNTALVRLRRFGMGISIVLLDLDINGMDAFEVLKKMRKSVEMQTIPVIVVSSHHDGQTNLEAIKCGAADFIAKPIEPELMQLKVKAAINKEENARLMAQNSMLLTNNSEISKYRTAIDSAGIIIIEFDQTRGNFYYNPSISNYIAGNFDDGDFWEVLLSENVATARDVAKMQKLVKAASDEKEHLGDTVIVKLRTPSGKQHTYRMSAKKRRSETDPYHGIIMTFIDISRDI